MRITIIGGGKVGAYLAAQLEKEKHDITVVDSNERVITGISNTMDVIGCVGNGAAYDVLRSIDIDRCDLLIAVTATDEVNLLCCLTAHKLGAKHTIARVRNPEYSGQLVVMQEDLGLSMAINPERVSAEEIARTLRLPSATHVELFAKGRVEMVACRVLKDTVLDGLALRSIPSELGARVLICAVVREGSIAIPSGNFVIQAGDTLYLTGAPGEIEKTFSKAKLLTNRLKNVMIGGGSRIAYYLADNLSKKGISVKLIERDERRALELADALPRVSVLCGDIADHELLKEEGLRQQDAYAALTGLDEGNILSALYAGSLNVPKVVAKANNENFIELFKDNGLLTVITPKLVTANLILLYVRAMAASRPSRNALSMYKLAGGRAEALEFMATYEDGPLLGVPLMELNTKKDILIACLVRDGKVIIPCGSDCILAGDSVMVVTANQRLDVLGDILEARS